MGMQYALSLKLCLKIGLECVCIYNNYQYTSSPFLHRCSLAVVEMQETKERIKFYTNVHAASVSIARIHVALLATILALIPMSRPGLHWLY